MYSIICSNIYTSNCKATDISARVCCYANRGRLLCSAIYKFWFLHRTRHNPILISLRIIGKNRWLVSRNWRDVKKRGRSTYVIGIVKKWWPRTSAPTWPFSLGTRHLKRTKNEDANSSFRLGTFFSFLKLFGLTHGTPRSTEIQKKMPWFGTHIFWLCIPQGSQKKYPYGNISCVS